MMKNVDKSKRPWLFDRITNPPPGRPKGSHNKFTTLKDAFVEAFKEIGGQKALVDWVSKDGKILIRNKAGKVLKEIFIGDRKKEFFKMIAQMLPREGAPLIDQSTHLHINNLQGEALVSEARRRGLPVPEPIARRFGDTRKTESMG